MTSIRPLYVRLHTNEMEALREWAQAEHRRPQDQAAAVLAKELGRRRRQENTPRLMVLNDGAPEGAA
jgi:hypothetical protein